MPELKANRDGKERTKVLEKYRILITNSNVDGLKENRRDKGEQIKRVHKGCGEAGWAGVGLR